MLSKKFYLSCLLFIFLIPVGILYPAEGVSLNSLITQALKDNPQIRAAKFRYEAAKSRVKLLRTLDDPKTISEPSHRQLRSKRLAGHFFLHAYI